MEQSPGKITMLCKEEEMEIEVENNNETKHCCLLEQIKYVRNEISSAGQQEEQSFEEQYSFFMERESNHMMDDTSTNIWSTSSQKRNDDMWERKYNYLWKFYEREGHCNVPHCHVEDGIKLGN